MNRKLLCALITVLVIVCNFSAFAPASASSVKQANSDNNGFNEEKVLETRFLNMLNHNFVYDSDFENEESIVNDSVIALIDMRDKADESFISETYVKNFVYSMYGVEISDFSDINSQLPKKDGYVYIIPRGFTVYRHSIVSVNLNEDGSYTVVSDVDINGHDGAVGKATAISLFVKNASSDFGYNIIYSDIHSSVSDI